MVALKLVWVTNKTHYYQVSGCVGFLETGGVINKTPLPVFEVRLGNLETGWGNKQDLITSFEGLK